MTRTSAPKLDAAVEEIVRTEGDYVVALRTLVSGYIPKLRDMLDADELVTIFGNAETILGVHVELQQVIMLRCANAHDRATQHAASCAQQLKARRRVG